MHVHQSIWNEDSPLSYDEAGWGGLSDMARFCIGGILEHAPSLQACSQRNRSACARIPITNPRA